MAFRDYSISPGHCRRIIFADKELGKTGPTRSKSGRAEWIPPSSGKATAPARCSLRVASGGTVRIRPVRPRSVFFPASSATAWRPARRPPTQRRGRAVLCSVPRNACQFGNMKAAKGLARTCHLTLNDRTGNLARFAEPWWDSLCCGRVLLGLSPGFRQGPAHSLRPRRMLRRLGHARELCPPILNLYLLGSWQIHPTIAPPWPKRPNGARASPRFPWKWLSRGSLVCGLTGSWEPSWCSSCWAWPWG